MNRLIGQAIAVVALGVLSTAVMPACAENDQSIFIRNMLGPAQNRQNNACVYSSDPTQLAISEGILDIGVADSYRAALLVGNQLIARGDGNNTRSESNRARLDGAVVRVTDPNGGTLGEFTSLGSGFVEPQLNNQPSFGPFFVTILDSSTIQKVAGQVTGEQGKLVIANIKVFGRTLGGVDLETGEFQYPIRLCNGCLVSFASGDDPATPGRDCNLKLESGGTNNLPCNPGQDEVTPCQTCIGKPACGGG